MKKLDNVDYTETFETINPKSNPYYMGWQWFKAAYGIFKMRPILWIALSALVVAGKYFLPSQAMIIPKFFSALISAFVIIIAHEVFHQRGLSIKTVFSYFEGRLSQLFTLLVVYIFSVFVIFSLGYIIFGEGIISLFLHGPSLTVFGEIFSSVSNINSLVLGLIVFSVVMIFSMVSIVSRYAITLVILHKLNVLQAIKFSFIGFFKNIRAIAWFFLIYVTFILLAIVLTLGLGLLLLIPILFISSYPTYLSIFTNKSIGKSVVNIDVKDDVSALPSEIRESKSD